MPRHDFSCGCGATLVDVYIPVAFRASERPPTCPYCATPMDWIPAIGSMGLIQESTREVVQILQPDGSHKPVTISSIADIRRLEKETEQAHRNGEGQPLRWRDYSNDRSNRDANTFGPDPGVRPDPKWVAKADLRPTDEAGADALAYGPGVSDANTSAIASE